MANKIRDFSILIVVTIVDDSDNGGGTSDVRLACTGGFLHSLSQLFSFLSRPPVPFRALPFPWTDDRPEDLQDNTVSGNAP